MKIRHWVFLFILLEIAVFVLVGRAIGLGWTLLLVVCTSVVGVVVQRRSGFGAMMNAARQMQSGGPMPEKLPNGFATIGALLLIVPGFVTDVLGLVLLLPFVQHGVQAWARKKGFVPPPVSANDPQRAAQHNPHVIEGEVVDEGRQ